MTLMEKIELAGLAIALGALVCNVAMTALTLWRACETRHDMKKLITHIGIEK